jgi:hypothetical protein
MAATKPAPPFFGEAFRNENKSSVAKHSISPARAGPRNSVATHSCRLQLTAPSTALLISPACQTEVCQAGNRPDSLPPDSKLHKVIDPPILELLELASLFLVNPGRHFTNPNHCSSRNRVESVLIWLTANALLALFLRRRWVRTIGVRRGSCPAFREGHISAALYFFRPVAQNPTKRVQADHKHIFMEHNGMLIMECMEYTE